MTLIGDWRGHSIQIGEDISNEIGDDSQGGMEDDTQVRQDMTLKGDRRGHSRGMGDDTEVRQEMTLK